MRVLVTGWFSFLHGEATAGDLLAGEVAASWLTDAGIDHDVSRSPVLGGPSPDEVDPGHYTHLVFVCGPAAGWQVDALVRRFADCRRIAVGVSQVAGTDPGAWDVLLTRDGLPAAHPDRRADGPAVSDRPDLSLGAPLRRVPVVAVVRANPQPEYADGLHDEVHRALDAFLRRRGVVTVPVDTRVDPRLPDRSTPAHVESLLARMDAVVTTRLHGLVLALRVGVPALAVDPVAGGAKVSAAARVLAWPAIVAAEVVNEGPRLDRWLDWCLSEDGRRAVADGREPALRRLGTVRAELLASLA